MKVDRRVRRTVERLRTALFELIAIKNYDRITVQDILDRADVGRSTFYAHFPSKDALLMSGPPPGTVRQGGEPLEVYTATGAPTVVGLFEHAADGFHLFESLKGTSAMDVFLGSVRSDLEQRLTTWFEGREAQGGSDFDAATAAQFHAAGTLSLIHI